MISITIKEFKQLADYIKLNYGIQLKQEKMALVTGRLQHVLQQAGFQNFTDYYNYILTDQSGEAAITLINKITTNHTYFMREMDHFDYFKQTVLPYLKHTIKDKDLRIWCAACSTGEESYTLAILLDEYFADEKKLWDTKILATDISEKVLEIASKGIYSNERIDPLPNIWKLKYFEKYNYEYSKITEEIRREVIYRKFNLIEPAFPFKRKFHVIFCRNVMIYFDHETKTDLIQKLYDQLEYGGYLFVGHSESLNRQTNRFRYVIPSVYQKV